MKKVLAYGGMILLFVLLQCSFFTHLSLADVVPNLLIILTASIAIINGSLEGCLVGFFSGLLLDLMFGPYIGMYAFGYLLCGYLTGIGNRIFYKEDITFPVLNVLFYLRRIILPEAVYTVIIAIFLYRIILIITEHLQKKGSENLIV